MKNNNRKHECFHCIVFFITMIFLSIKKHWIISFIYFILLICLLNQLTSSFIDYNYHKYYISISMFFVTSTLALYVFLYRERKDTNKSYSYNSIQFNFFLITLITSLIFFGLNFLEKNSITLSYINIIFFITLSLYIINLIVSICYTNVYYIALTKIKFLKSSLKGYKLALKFNILSSINCFLLIFICLILLISIHFKYKEMSNYFFITFIFVSFFYFYILVKIDYKKLYLQFLNLRAYNLNKNIYFISGTIEKQTERKLLKALINYNEELSKILFGDLRVNSDYVMLQLETTEPNNISISLVSIYSNVLNTYKDIILKSEIDEDVVDDVKIAIFKLIPIVNFNGIRYDIKNELLKDLDNKYSKEYIKHLPTILNEFSIDKNKYNKDFIRQYIEVSATDIQEYIVMKNESKLLENNLIIDNKVLFDSLKNNDLKSLVEFSAAVLVKKNLGNPYLNNSYISTLIMLLIKAIELSHLTIAGYLTKLICNNYSAEIINENFNNILKKYNLKYLTREDSREIAFHDVENINIFFIHKPSLKYCYCKALLLIKIYNLEPQKIKVNIFEVEKKDKIYSMFNRIIEDREELGFTKISITEFNSIFLKKYYSHN